MYHSTATLISKVVLSHFKSFSAFLLYLNENRQKFEESFFPLSRRKRLYCVLGSLACESLTHLHVSWNDNSTMKYRLTVECRTSKSHFTSEGVRAEFAESTSPAGVQLKVSKQYLLAQSGKTIWKSKRIHEIRSTLPDEDFWSIGLDRNYLSAHRN